MQYLVIAHDGSDAEAPARRQRCRADHLAGIAKLKSAGHVLFGGAILDDQGNMIGSVGVFEFPDRTHLDAWLAQDPYVTGRVWQKISVHPYRLATFN